MASAIQAPLPSSWPSSIWGTQRMRWLDASLTRWTWVWASSRSGWWTGKPGVLQSMWSQRGGHNRATELNSWLCGAAPFSHGAAQGSWFPQLPWEMGPESPSLGHHWPPPLSAHTCPLIHLFFPGKTSWSTILTPCLGVHCWRIYPKTENLTSTSLQPSLTRDYF